MQPKVSPFLRSASKPQAHTQNHGHLTSPSAYGPPQQEDEIRGKHNMYKQTLASLLSEEEFGEIRRLAYLTEGEEVLIDQEGLYLLQKYSICEVAFLGFLGHDDLSRSFIMDIGLNLCSCQGNHFTSVYGRNQEEAIYMWSLPFTHHPKVKVFMLSCTGIPQGGVLQRRHQILLDLMVMLSSTIVLINIPDLRRQRSKRIFQYELQRGAIEGDYLQQWVRKLQSSGSRIVNPDFIVQKEDPFWAQSFYSIQPFKFDSSVRKQLLELFSRVSCIEIDSPLARKEQSVEELLLSLNEPYPDVNPSFLKYISSFLVDSLKSITSKQYQGLKITGNIVCKWLINSMKYMNRKPIVKLNKIFNSIFKELYQASLLFHTENYEQLLQSHFLTEQPKSFDSLLQIFASVQSAILTSFNQNIINAKIHEQYQDRLLGHIGDKEQLIIDVNFRKNKLVIADQINEIQQSTVFNPEYIRKYIEDVKVIVTRHDHNPIELIVDKLMKYSHNLEQRIIDQKIKLEQQAIQQLRIRLKEKQAQYLKTKEANDQIRKANQTSQKNYKKKVKELQQFDGTIKAVKKAIEAQKKFQKEYMISKESKKQVAEGLLEQVRELEEKTRDNNKLMDEINKEYDYHPEILALNKKLEDQEKQVRLLERNQSRIYSNIQNSFIRQAVQKTPDNGSHIQKSTIRQVLQKPAESEAQQRKPIKRLSSSKQ